MPIQTSMFNILDDSSNEFNLNGESQVSHAHLALRKRKKENSNANNMCIDESHEENNREEKV